MAGSYNSIGQGAPVELSIVQSTLGGDKDFSTLDGGITDSGLSMTFNTDKDDQIVLLSLVSSALWDTFNGLVNVFVYYQLDGGSDVQIVQTQVADPTTGAPNAASTSVTLPITIPSVGSHTIKIRGDCPGSGTRIWTMPAALTVASVTVLG